MGTVLGVLFIVGAAAAGVLVGTRPTVMDGGWIAGKLATDREAAGTIECDRAIPVGVAGARFACIHSRLGARQRIWYRMARDGTVAPTRAERGPRAEDAGAGEGSPGEDAPGED